MTTITTPSQTIPLPEAVAATPSAAAGERRDELTGRLFQASLGAFEMLTVYVGDRLGWYRALAKGGPATAAELAARTGTHERYAREWLEQQAVAGILDADDPTAASSARRYALPAGHDAALLNATDLGYLPPLLRFLVAIPRAMPSLLEAYRTGGGVAYGDFGDDARRGQADLNRPAFVHLLGQQWLPAIADVHARLQADPPARVADVACGEGWSSLAIAKAYPKARVDGFDLDAPSIERARQNAPEAGVADRVRFDVRDAADGTIDRCYDLVTIFEALHDMADPVGALRTVRGILAPDGVALVVDERAAEQFEAPGDDLQRFFYSASLLFCLPTGMADGTPDQPAAGTGTVLRPDTLRRYAREAGFADIAILPIEHDQFRFYRLIAD